MTQVPTIKRRHKHVYENRGEPVFQAFLIIVFVLLSITFLYPYWHMLVISFTHSDYSVTGGFQFWPKQFCTDSFTHMLRNARLWSGYRSTLTICAMGLVLSLTGVVLAAYPLSKKDLPFRTLFTVLITVTMFISGGMIPTFLLVSNTLKLNNTYWAVVLPQAISAYNIIIARNYFLSLPTEIEEAATIDGANSLQTLWQVILPLSMPILATIGLWVTVSNWNAYFNCMLYIDDPDKKVLQLVLRAIITNSGARDMTMVNATMLEDMGMDDTTLRAASIILSTLPILCVYPFVQKYFVKGVLVGSLKG